MYMYVYMYTCIAILQNIKTGWTCVVYIAGG